MNILQVTEIYKMGGLENYIDALSDELRSRGIKSFLAVGDYDSPIYDNAYKHQDGVFLDFGFKNGSNETIQHFIEDVDRICAVIEQNDIDFVLIHPFYSLFPALIASKIMRISCGYVIHGVYSCAFPMTPLVNALLRIALDCSVDHVFVTQDYFKKFVYSETPVTLLRNPVTISNIRLCDETLYASKRWALCSRLDGVKEKAIKDLLDKLPDLDISHLDVWGDGDLSDDLEQYALRKGLGDLVTWHGYNKDWLSHVLVDNCGVIGLGRVAIEALSANMPVILLNVEDGICGLVDRSLFNESIDSNFGKIGLPIIEKTDELNAQLTHFYASPSTFLLGEETRQLFSVQCIVDEFLESIDCHLNASSTKRAHEWHFFYETIKKNQEKNVAFSRSTSFADVLFAAFSIFTPFGVVKNSLFMMNEWSSVSKRLDLAEVRLDQLTEYTGEQSKEIDALRKELTEATSRLVDIDRFVTKLRNTLPFKAYRILRGKR